MKNLPKIAGDINTARSYASLALTEAVEKGQKISKDMQDDYISTEHLLLGLAWVVGKPATFKQFLKNFELSEKKIKDTLQNMRGGTESDLQDAGKFFSCTQKIWHRPCRTGQVGQAGSRHRS